ncbi:helix-turn-helix domain-containing protein [Actinacidiphila yeochonensis]|uniref:helix-turn-helix domain-containing protein n=1 Tax=Actinacidiphila yeochonensis TaxID=89050 RepID=UPI0018E2EB9D|nr:helix-turn-helix transcriptional regulator [Actinacidiphila yeochonensis]
MPAKRQTPTIRLRRLSGELRRLRDVSSLTREDVEARTGISNVTLYRIESARVRPQRRTVMGLLDLYGVVDPQRADILALLRQADEQSWLRPYHAELPDEYTAYISFESEARGLRNYESLFIPGLLQTEEYARAVIKGMRPTASNSEVDRWVQARMERQGVINRENPLDLWAIIDEAALRRTVGGGKVMRDQLHQLVQLAELPNVTFQVVPFRAGSHPGMKGSFALMDFPDPADPALVYIESLGGDLFLEAEADVQRHAQSFDHLRAMALSPEASASLAMSVATEIN